MKHPLAVGVLAGIGLGFWAGLGLAEVLHKTLWNDQTRPLEDIVVLGSAQGWAMFNDRCQSLLGVPAKEFFAAYDAGKAGDRWGESVVLDLEMLIPFARKVRQR